MSTLLVADASREGRVPMLATGDWLKREDGVREYFVWSVDEGRIDWWELRGGAYETIPLDDDNLARSRVFPGLWLDAHALIRGDLPAILVDVRRGVDAEA